MRRMNRVLAHIWIAALLAGCAGLPVPESAQTGSTQTVAAGAAAPQGVSPESPVAGVALAVSCRTGRGCLLLPIEIGRASCRERVL